MYRKLRWGRWRGCRLCVFACISTVPNVKAVRLLWIGYLYSLLAHAVWQKMSRTESLNGDEGGLRTSFGYFKYFRDLKVCINYFVCEEPFSCLFILLVFIRESLRKMQHFHLEKNINFSRTVQWVFRLNCIFVCAYYLTENTLLSVHIHVFVCTF